MKWIRFLFLLAVLAAIGCSSSPAPEQMSEEAPAADPAAEAEALKQ